MVGWLTDVEGIQVGHWTDGDGATGCTVVVCDPAAVGAVDVRGGAPGTRETDLLRPGGLVQRVDAILLTGGSAFGLAAATGVVRYLEERGRGYPTAAGLVPIVPAAVIYDLATGDARSRPDDAAGFAACEAAQSGPVEEGSVGAGMGAVVARRLGPAGMLRGGVGTARRVTSDGAVVGSLVVVNALGMVYDEQGQPLSGGKIAPGDDVPALFGNSTIGVVATDATLDRLALTRLAAQGQNGLARCIRPVHTQFDGDTLFALSTERRVRGASLEELGELAAAAVVEAVLRAVRHAKPFGGIRSVGAQA